MRALWVERRFSPRSPTGEAQASLWYSNVRTAAGVIADCAHRTKGDEQAFKTCQLMERSGSSFADAGSRTFELRAPARPRPRARLHVRLVDVGSSRGAPRPRVALTSRAARVTLRLVSGRPVRVADDVFVGWTPTKNLSLVAAYLNIGSVLAPATQVTRHQDGPYLSVQAGF